MLSRSDNPKLAVSIILVVVLCLALGDALVKEISSSLAIWQIFVLRSLLALAVLLAVLRCGFPSLSLRPRRLGWTMARSAMLVLMWIAYYASLPHLQLSVAAAAYYTSPLFIVLFSAALGGERVSRFGCFAVFLGFGGTILILRPTAGAFNAYALLPLLSAILYALAMTLTRTKCRHEHPLILSAVLNVTFVAVGLIATAAIGLLDGTPSPFLSATWAPLGARDILAVLFLTGAILVASVGAAMAYQIGRPPLVATFDFAYLAFAAVCGFLFFGEVPGPSVLAGMLAIAAAGAIALNRS